MALPSETVIQILDSSEFSNRDFRNISLISRVWCWPAQSLLHRRINISLQRDVQQYIRKFTLFPHLLAAVRSMHIFGATMISYSEGSLDFEETVMGDKFEDMSRIVGSSVRNLHLDSFLRWDTEMSRRISSHFCAIQKLELSHIGLVNAPNALSRLFAGMEKLESLHFHHTSFGYDDESLCDPPVDIVSSAPGKHLHTLVISTVQESREVLTFLGTSSTLDLSHVNNLTLSWTYTKREPVPLHFLHDFLRKVGPQVGDLTIATPAHNIDDQTGMDVPFCLGDILSSEALGYFSSMKKLTLCACPGGAYDYFSCLYHREKVALCHAVALLQSLDGYSSLEEIRIKLIAEGRIRQPVQLPLWFRLRDVLHSDNFSKLKKSHVRIQEDDDHAGRPMFPDLEPA
ncbi:hypothetical protein VNI00_007835 [Paramarasmius palmivorus]|uniref:F-box domain-containing protein n=1 Tax=Paramarasmius palmivorus TaxID=297713 RepID=A0AAW0CY47_9AGAR